MGEEQEDVEFREQGESKWQLRLSPRLSAGTTSPRQTNMETYKLEAKPQGTKEGVLSGVTSTKGVWASCFYVKSHQMMSHVPNTSIPTNTPGCTRIGSHWPQRQFSNCTVQSPKPTIGAGHNIQAGATPAQNPCSKTPPSSFFPTTQKHRSQGQRGLTGHHGKFQELHPAQLKEPGSSLLPKFLSDSALSPRKELRKGRNLFLFEASIRATKKTVKHK